MAKSIEFPGTAGNRYEHAINNNQDLTGTLTILAVVRILAANGSWQSVIESQGAGALQRPSMGRHSSDVVYYSDSTAAFAFSGLGLTAANGWCMIASTRPAGTGTTLRGHRVVFGNIPAHEDDESTTNNQTAYPTGTFFVAGPSDPANIRVAAWAIWDGTALTDGQFDGIATAKTTQSILDLSPTACFDSENGLMLTDLVGAMDGTLIGAITESSDGPTDWSYFGQAADAAWVTTL